MADDGEATNVFPFLPLEMIGYEWKTYKSSLDQRIDDWPKGVELICDTMDFPDPPEDIMFFEVTPVFSAKVVKALSEHNIGSNDLQLLPVGLRHVSGTTYEDFFIANVIATPICLDRERAKLEIAKRKKDKLTNQLEVESIFTAAFFTEPLEGHDFIRPLEYLMATYCSERFKLLCEKLDAKGARFRGPVQTRSMKEQ